MNKKGDIELGPEIILTIIAFIALVILLGYLFLTKTDILFGGL